MASAPGRIARRRAGRDPDRGARQPRGRQPRRRRAPRSTSSPTATSRAIAPPPCSPAPTARSQAGNAPAAIATLRSIADERGLRRALSPGRAGPPDRARIRQLQPQEVIRRLGPLAGAGSAWLGSAGEMVGVAYLKMNRPDLAGPIFAADRRATSTCPASIRTRAIQMAGLARIRAPLDEQGGSGRRRRARGAGRSRARNEGKSRMKRIRPCPRRDQPAWRLRRLRRTAGRPRRPSASASPCSAPKARSRPIRRSPTMPVTVPAPVANHRLAAARRQRLQVDGPCRARRLAARRLWSVSIGNGNSFRTRLVAEPVVADGRVYTIDTLARVRAFNVDTGASIWTHQVRGENSRRARRCSAAASASTAAASTRPTAPATSPRSTPRPATSSGW